VCIIRKQKELSECMAGPLT